MLERIAAGGKMCEPRLKYQRSMGREREAGWERSWGISIREVVVREPAARREVVMERSWVVVVMMVGRAIVRGLGKG